MLSVLEKVQAGDYRSQLPVLNKPPRPQVIRNATGDQLRDLALRTDAYDVLRRQWVEASDARQADSKRLHDLFKAEAVAEVFGRDAADWPNLILHVMQEIEDVGGSFEYMLHRLESFAVRLEAIKADHAKLLQVAHQKWYEVNFQPWVEMAHRVEVSDGA